MKTKSNARPLIAAGFVLGVGMGGFIDGILFHQILQIHNMISNILFPDTLVNADINMFWDGLFHAFTWVMTLAGIMLLWKAATDETVPKSTPVLMSSMIIGFGTFNLIEGIVDHQILQLHHVVQRAIYPIQLYWDLAFLASGVALLSLGCYFLRAHLKYKA